MANEFFTFIFVPHAKARFRRFQIRVRAAKWLGATAGVLLVLTMFMLAHYAWISVEVHDVRRLRAENATLRAKTEKDELERVRLSDQLRQLQNTVTKLGVMAGLEHSLPDPQATAGVGGAKNPSSENGTADLSIKDMQRSASRLSERSAELEAFYRDQKVLLSSTPSIWPALGYRSTAFGNRVDPFTGQWDFHPGIDISAPIGTKVVAPADGVVVTASVKGAYGNAVTINHSFGIVTQYGHLDRFNVSPGQRVHRGDVIGFVGSTGRSTGPHLHYEVWVRDQAQNPIHFILDEYRSLG